eukprot:363314-Chlamydomonas_euryale.AAC.5
MVAPAAARGQWLMPDASPGTCPWCTHPRQYPRHLTFRACFISMHATTLNCQRSPVDRRETALALGVAASLW